MIDGVIEAGDLQAGDDFPQVGDNFRTVGLWRILEGSGWHKWQAAALAAEIAVSRYHGDDISAARQISTLRCRMAEAACAPAGAPRAGIPAAAAPSRGRPDIANELTASLRDQSAS